MKPLNLSGDIKGPLEFQREVDRIIRGIPTVTLKNTPHFRDNTVLPTTIHNYYLRGGGMGDRICIFAALDYVARTCPWIWGRIWIHEDLIEFSRNIIEQTGNQNWKVGTLEEFKTQYEPDTMITGRGFEDPSGKVIFRHIGATGAGGHLVQMGYCDHVGRYNPREGWDFYPVIDFNRWTPQRSQPIIIDLGLDRPFGDWRKKYVVFTTGAIAPSRDVPGYYWNPIIEDVKSRGLTPVFLGISGVTDAKAGKIKVRYSDGCNYGEGIDLRDKTSVMEAAWIMKNAAAVIGLDNGLIQLASCTDASIICAYNIVDPMDRRPKRKAGRWEEIYPTSEELPCIGCQTWMEAIAPPHNFKQCLYGDLRCVDIIFENQGERFRKALDRILDLPK